MISGMKYFHKTFQFALHLKHLKAGLCNLLPQRRLKSISNLKWVEPEKKPSLHPSNSGDLQAFQIPPKETLRLGYETSDEIKSANDMVKKVFSLEYLHPWHSYNVYKSNLVDKIKSHIGDDNSIEVKIAKLTAAIRFYQPLIMTKKRPAKGKMTLKVKELIDSRERKLRVLRSQDYKKFEWVLEELNLVYKPRVLFDGSITREKAMTLLANLKAEQKKEQDLAILKKSLDKEKVSFLEKKLEKLKWIKSTEEKHNLDPTITNDDIKKCDEKLKEVKIEMEVKLNSNYVRKIHPYTLDKYHEDLLLQKENSITCE